MITNGKDFSIGDNNTALPNMSTALLGWMQNIRVGLVGKAVVVGRVQETVTYYDTTGVKQPFSDEQLSILPEGQRSWKWFTLHCLPSLPLRTDDTIILSGSRYRVMSRGNFDEYGFAVYNLVQDYETVIPETP